MYNDANLPVDEAWAAMAQDLRETKEARNNLTKENSYVFSFFSYNTLVLKI
jgi:protein ECT2